MKSAVVSSKDVFDKKKNPHFSLSAEDILRNKKIKKYACFSCEHQTNDKEDNCGCHSSLVENDTTVKVWYVLKAYMLTSESTVQIFRSDAEARKYFETEKNELIKSMGQKTYDELKDNRDFINEGDTIFWVEGSLLAGQSDIYLEIGHQVV